MLRDDLERGPRVFKKVPEHFERSGTFKVDSRWEGADKFSRVCKGWGMRWCEVLMGFGAKLLWQKMSKVYLYCSIQCKYCLIRKTAMQPGCALTQIMLLIPK